jgi:RepB DNA-primase from phage plasmid/CHC2 zinc finger
MTALAVRGAPTPAPDDLQRYLRLLAGPEPDGRLLEIRFRLRGGGMGREFVPAESCARAAGIIIRRLALVTDVYVGVALRDRRAGGRDAIGRCHLLFVEIDTPDAQDRLDRFQWPATATISSGGEGRRHCYWELCTPVGPHECERANRQLTHRLGADPVAVDASRLLRPPASWNWKYNPRQPVRLLDLKPERRYELGELLDGLPDPLVRTRQAAPARVRELRHPLDETLLGIPAEQYVRALTGREPNRAGKLHCPFHEDRHPSLQLYADGSWYCFGACRRGGTIYDFAAALWLTGTKGRGFIELRDRLAAELGVAR